jgi:hypothetical protein
MVVSRQEDDARRIVIALAFSAHCTHVFQHLPTLAFELPGTNLALPMIDSDDIQDSLDHVVHIFIRHRQVQG